MQLRDGELRLSPSDLAAHLACAHTTTLRLADVETRGRTDAPAGEYARLIMAKGLEHEAAYRARLEGEGRRVVDVAPRRDTGATADLMRSGADVIFQAPLEHGRWFGIADFLVRVDGESALGPWSYIAVDTKLARNEAKPSHVLQLCFYSEALAAIQGRWPERAEIALGSGRPERIRLAEVAPFYRHARRTYEQRIAGLAQTEPYPCAHCAYCAFRTRCEEIWEARDHLSRVASIRRSQVDVLEGHGIGRLADLARAAPEDLPPDISVDARRRLTAQSRLQVETTRRGSIAFEPIAAEPGRGLARLPRPSPGDVMFDIEGDPVWRPEQDLTFLFGLLLREGEEWSYRAIWAHDEAGERHAFEAFIDLVTARQAADPGMHVYHYSAAEPSVVRRLMARYATREAEVDHLLRTGAFVDLYAVVCQAFRVGVRSYGLKQIERLAGFERAADVGSGAGAVLAYERWLGSRAPTELEQIEAYNAEDCEATLAVRGWLLRQQGGSSGSPVSVPPERREPTEEVLASEALRAELIADAAPGDERWLAGELLEYHRREARPAWWRHFEVLEMNEEEMLADREVVAGLVPTGAPPVRLDRSLVYELAFPPQDHRLKAGQATDPLSDAAKPRSYTVIEVDDVAGVLRIKRGLGKQGDGLPTALAQTEPINHAKHVCALTRLAEVVRDDGGAYPALRSVLRRDRSRFRSPVDVIQTTDLDEQKHLARSLDESYLLIQGPPGTGKTWTGARLIVDLLAQGCRVGVTAVSHHAINNLLAAVEPAAREAGLTFRGLRHVTKEEVELRDPDQIENGQGSTDDHDYGLFGATTWSFAGSKAEGQFDYLVIDEAGQMSLADALAAGTAARNLILLGDPLQLPQVSQATHPKGTNASVLEHLLGDEATVSPDRGIFLDTTRRLHPDLNRFISDQVYEGRLSAHEECARQSTGLGTGLRAVAVDHAGDSTQSQAEAEAIRVEIARLLGTSLTEADGRTRALRAADIMVVAPFNAQVRLLLGRLQPGVRIGTVDRFQGQEAAVVFFSMTSSSGEDTPRGIDFVFNRNRLNVAISRARCLAYLVYSPALIGCAVRSVDEMKMVSTVCALLEMARGPN